MTLSQHRRLERLERLQKRVHDRFDTSYIDISRPIQGQIIVVYPNISARINRKVVDAPNPTATSSIPVQTSIQISVPVGTDIRNGDRITAKQVNSKGEITAAWCGDAGAPYENDGRIHFFMAENALGRDDIIDSVTPPPHERCVDTAYAPGNICRDC